MRARWISPLALWVVFVMALSPSASAATKVHVIAFGKWITVQCASGYREGDPPLALKIRPLLVDGRVKEYVIGSPHEVTDRLFVVRRAFRVNDSLPDEANVRWLWQRGGWLLMDRVTGHISVITLPDFDAVYSAATWYRDYVAYCGVTDDGKKTYAVVAQLNRKKAVLRKQIGEGLADDAAPDSVCGAPEWQRDPVRVSFRAAGADKQTFAVRGRVADLVDDAEDE